jgi:LPS export ABC transporter protein LptC
MPLSHTSRVTVLRWIFPILAVLVLIGVVAIPALKEFNINRLSEKSKTRLKVEEISLSMPKSGEPMELQVSKPEYSGLDAENRPYVITADKVIQKGLTNVTEMNLEHPLATLTLNTEKNETLVLNASTGLYDPKAKTLALSGPVKLMHTLGYDLNMQSLNVDLTKGTAVTDQPVTGSGPAGTLSGDSLQLLERGNHIILKGRSKLVINPNTKDALDNE